MEELQAKSTQRETVTTGLDEIDGQLRDAIDSLTNTADNLSSKLRCISPQLSVGPDCAPLEHCTASQVEEINMLLNVGKKLETLRELAGRFIELVSRV